MKRYKIGIFGSAVKEHPEAIAKAKELARELTKQNVIIITGACSGMPYTVAHEAAKNGSEIWGFSPNVDKTAQLEMYKDDDISIYKKIFYIPHNYRQLFFVPEDEEFVIDQFARQKYRNTISTANCDAGIIISGRWGTLNEFTNLVDMGKVVGVLTGTGGIADELLNLTKKIKKAGKGKVIFHNSPKELIKDMLYELQNNSF